MSEPSAQNRSSLQTIIPVLISLLSGGVLGVGGYQAFLDPRKPADVEQRVLALEQRMLIEIESLRAEILAVELRTMQYRHDRDLSEIKSLILELKGMSE